jgi:transposase-like protein
MQKRQGTDLDWDSIIEELKRGDTSISVLARRYNIGRSIIQDRFIEAVGTPYRFYQARLDEAKYEKIREYANARPEVTYPKIAKLFNTSIASVSRALKGFSKVDAQLKVIKALIKSRPLATYPWIAAQTGRSYRHVKEAVYALAKEGWYLDLEREILVAEYFENNPGASVADAAAHFETSTTIIYSVVNRREYEIQADEFDENWAAACIDAPPKTQEEIRAKDGFGIRLNPAEMARFVALHDKKVKDSYDAAF